MTSRTQMLAFVKELRWKEEIAAGVIARKRDPDFQTMSRRLSK